MQAQSSRQWLLRGVLFAVTTALAVINGLPLTPFFDSISYILYLFTRGSSLIAGDVLFYGTTAFIAAVVGTMMLAGLLAVVAPAATVTALSIRPPREGSGLACPITFV